MKLQNIVELKSGCLCIGSVTTKHFGAEEACWAHNPKVGGSKPPSATFLYFFDLEPLGYSIVYLIQPILYQNRFCKSFVEQSCSHNLLEYIENCCIIFYMCQMASSDATKKPTRSLLSPNYDIPLCVQGIQAQGKVQTEGGVLCTTSYP